MPQYQWPAPPHGATGRCTAAARGMSSSVADHKPIQPRRAGFPVPIPGPCCACHRSRTQGNPDCSLRLKSSHLTGPVPEGLLTVTVLSLGVSTYP